MLPIWIALLFGQAIPPPLAPADAARVAALVAAAKERGNAARGAAVFGDARHACLSCHQLGASGGAVGPSLTIVGACLSAGQLAESILWPEREIKPEFAATIVERRDGSRAQGYRRRESAAELVLFDPATNRETTVLKADVERRRDGVSLMPANLAAGMPAEDLRDLVRFLSECKGTAGSALLAHAHAPATFPWRRDALDLSLRPAWQEHVNRDRLYDFYAKQAEFFRTATPRPLLLQSFPGLDGVAHGHWGNQNEQTWRDGRWQNTDLGRVQAGVLRIGEKAFPRAVCVRLGEHGELACAFDPETLSYPAAWAGGLVKVSDVRHGIMDAVYPAGLPQPGAAALPHAESVRYRGYYRHGNRTLFAYRVGAVDWLDAPWVVDGKFVRTAGPAATHPLRNLTHGGPAQWPQEFPVRGVLGKHSPYAVDTVPLPADNPWKSLLFVGDHDFRPDGAGIVAMIHGDVWRVAGLAGDLARPVWRIEISIVAAA